MLWRIFCGVVILWYFVIVSSEVLFRRYRGDSWIRAIWFSLIYGVFDIIWFTGIVLIVIIKENVSRVLRRGKEE